MPETKISQDVRQDHRGRSYRVEYFAASGKIRQYIYVDSDASQFPPGRTVPVPTEPATKRPTLRKTTEQTVNQVAVVELRYIGNKHISTFSSPFAREAQNFVDENCRPLMRWTGTEWIVAFSSDVDYFNQYHR